MKVYVALMWLALAIIVVWAFAGYLLLQPVAFSK